MNESAIQYRIANATTVFTWAEVITKPTTAEGTTWPAANGRYQYFAVECKRGKVLKATTWERGGQTHPVFPKGKTVERPYSFHYLKFKSVA